MNRAAAIDIEATVLRVLAEQLGQHLEDLARENKLADMGADSLDIVEIAMALEEEFEIEIADEEWEQVRTVGQAIDILRAKREGKPWPTP